MNFIKKNELLLILFVLLIYVAVTDKFSHDLLSGLVGAIIGALATMYAAESARRVEQEMRFLKAVKALREEVLFNKTIIEDEKDQKQITFSLTGWQNCTPYADRINADVLSLLRTAYTCVSRHAQAVQIELIRADRGQQLVELCGIINYRFTRALELSDWKAR